MVENEGCRDQLKERIRGMTTKVGEKREKMGRGNDSQSV
jgi:hypothetical protein